MIHRMFLVILAGILLAGCAPDTDRVLLGTLAQTVNNLSVNSWAQQAAPLQNRIYR